ncbi:MAG: peptidyl-prolyl cis-trans isomerase [Solirubrobacterales bacterium]|nr:peptidyl-prolyl cis-trans isomerase [Solirubrobacterales bacterium]
MTRHLRILLVFIVLAVPGALLVGCGGIPGNAVATVDGEPIAKDDFEHWSTVIAKSSGQASGVGKPPEFAACVADLRKTQAKPAKGQPKVTDAQLKTQCKQQYESVRDQAVQTLASFKWLDGEAEQLKVKVSDAEVAKELARIKKEQYPKKGDFEKLLKQTGFTEEDINLQVRTQLLTTKITKQVQKGKDKISDAEITAYYDKNKKNFAQPERRDLRVVLTKTKAKAEQAEKAIKSGDSFSSVVKEFSSDAASKEAGGKLPGVAKGQQEKAFDDAIFAAEKGQLEGPVKTQFGYYVFEVSKITAASQQALEEVKPTIKQTLTTEKQQKAIQDFAKKFQDEWKEKTECREGYVTTVCKGAPKATPTPAGAPPQQQQQQQPPQQPPAN